MNSHKCINCGTLFSGNKRKYCDVQCKSRYTKRVKQCDDLSLYEDKSSLGIKYAKPIKCTECGSLFKPRTHGSGKSQIYCGVDCAYNEARKKKVINSNEKKETLQIKASIKNLLKENQKKKERRFKEYKASTCNDCGTMIRQSFTLSRMYCDCCAKRRKKTTESNRRALFGKIKSHKQRAEKYGVNYELISRVKLFKSFDWTCQTCGIDTPRSLMKTYDKDNAPTMDHIKPISKGGDHMYYNLQLLCRLCNYLKSDKYDGCYEG